MQEGKSEKYKQNRKEPDQDYDSNTRFDVHARPSVVNSTG